MFQTERLYSGYSFQISVNWQNSIRTLKSVLGSFEFFLMKYSKLDHPT